MVEKDTKIEELFGMNVDALMDKYGPEAYLLIQKNNLYADITKLTNDLIEAKTSEKSQLGDLWTATIWEDVITGKATVDVKKAYVAEQLREYKEDCERIQAKIDAKWRDVDLINTLMKIGGIND